MQHPASVNRFSMSVTPSSDNRLPHPHLHTIRPKQAFSKTTSSSHNGSLCPNLQPPTPPVLPVNLEPKFTIPSTFGGKYVLRGQMEASSLYRCINTETLQEYVCTVSVESDRQRTKNCAYRPKRYFTTVFHNTRARKKRTYIARDRYSLHVRFSVSSSLNVRLLLLIF